MRVEQAKRSQRPGLVFVSFMAIAGFALLTGSSRVAQTERADAAPAVVWNEGVSKEGMKQRWAEMDFEVCVATKAVAIAGLNIGPNRMREIVNTNLMTMTRVCLDEGGSLLITCSRPDRRMIITESPHDRSVGCVAQ